MGTDYKIHIYFLRNPSTGLVKIGKSENFPNRYRTLCGEEGCELEILLLIYGDDTESRLHHRFRSFRDHHEWFRYEEELQEFVETYQDKEFLNLYVNGHVQVFDLDNRVNKNQTRRINELRGDLSIASINYDKLYRHFCFLQITPEYQLLQIRLQRESFRRQIDFTFGCPLEGVQKQAGRMIKYANISSAIDLFVFRLLCRADGVIQTILDVPVLIFYKILSIFT